VQKIQAAVDWFLSPSGPAAAGRKAIGVAGYGEGGLLALYTAALDERIDAAWVSGYFQPREELWREPLYRNVWGLLTEFGDAELAAMVAPRGLVVEYSRSPTAAGVAETGPPRRQEMKVGWARAPGRRPAGEWRAPMAEACFECLMLGRLGELRAGIYTGICHGGTETRS